jgi:hypothetical protein
MAAESPVLHFRRRLIMTKFLIAAAIIALPMGAKAEMITINVNRVCAAIVNIPYASDNFTDAEWEKFKNCRDYLRRFNGVE